MAKQTPVLVVLAIAAACANSKQDAPVAGSAAAPSSGLPTAGGARPAKVTAEMAETFELYVAAFEKLTADIEHAGRDCKAVLAVVKRDTKDVIAPLRLRGDKLSEAMISAKDDPAAGEWFATTFTARMQASAAKLKPLETNCADDAELRASVGEAMSQFPMMRKKHGKQDTGEGTSTGEQAHVESEVSELKGALAKRVVPEVLVGCLSATTSLSRLPRALVNEIEQLCYVDAPKLYLENAVADARKQKAEPPALRCMQLFAEDAFKAIARQPPTDPALKALIDDYTTLCPVEVAKYRSKASSSPAK